MGLFCDIFFPTPWEASVTYPGNMDRVFGIRPSISLKPNTTAKAARDSINAETEIFKVFINCSFI